eukprot:343578_1
MGNAQVQTTTAADTISMPVDAGKMTKDAVIDSVSNGDPKVKALMDHQYPSELKRKSIEELCSYIVQNFDENIDWNSTTYHKNATDIIQKKCKKECYDHFIKLFQTTKSLGFVMKTIEKEINVSSCRIVVEVELMDEQYKLNGHKMSMEDTWKCNENGLIVNLNSICKDLE